MLYNDRLETTDNSQSTNSAKTLKIFNVYSRLGENCNFYMFALREIARIYKALKHFADFQGPICYNDAQNKEMNLIVY